MVARPKLIRVGWREWVALPQLAIPAIKSKIDSGARTSCLNAHNIRMIREDGVDGVSFEVTPLREHSSSFVLQCRANMIDEREVRSSNGSVALRPFVKTQLLMGGTEWPIELSLADRRHMKFPLLLGRQALRNHVLVNVGRSYLLGRSLPHWYRDHGLPKKPRKTM